MFPVISTALGRKMNHFLEEKPEDSFGEIADADKQLAWVDRSDTAEKLRTGVTQRMGALRSKLINYPGLSENSL